jgi:hypothetical protein
MYSDYPSHRLIQSHLLSCSNSSNTSQEFQRFPKLRERVGEIVTGFLRRRMRPTTQMVSALINIEMAYIKCAAVCVVTAVFVCHSVSLCPRSRSHTTSQHQPPGLHRRRARLAAAGGEDQGEHCTVYPAHAAADGGSCACAAAGDGRPTSQKGVYLRMHTLAKRER